MSIQLGYFGIMIMLSSALYIVAIWILRNKKAIAINILQSIFKNLEFLLSCIIF